MNWYVKMALLALADVACIVALYWLIKRDTKNDALLIEDGNLFIVDSVPDNDLSRELLQEQREYNDRHRVPRPAREFESRPFALDADTEPKRAS